MSPDPNLFLSTIAAVSAALVAIIGGLLVARFVGLDSDQRTSRRARDAINGRLKLPAIGPPRRMAALSGGRHDFLDEAGVMAAIFAGQIDLAELRALADCPLSDDDLRLV